MEISTFAMRWVRNVCHFATLSLSYRTYPTRLRGQELAVLRIARVGLYDSAQSVIYDL